MVANVVRKHLGLVDICYPRQSLFLLEYSFLRIYSKNFIVPVVLRRGFRFLTPWKLSSLGSFSLCNCLLVLVFFFHSVSGKVGCFDMAS